MEEPAEALSRGVNQAVDQDLYRSENRSQNRDQMVTIQVNGEARQCSAQTYLPVLLEQLGMNPRLVAVEYNGEILHRQFWSNTEIREGDRLEIVTIVGGG
jgi:sulfur carrier protein